MSVNSAEFTTVTGEKLHLRPVSLVAQATLRAKLEAEYKSAGRRLAPPTYRVATATGTVEEYPHDESTLETEADKAAWAEYKKTQEEFTAEFTERFVKLLLWQGVEIPDAPPGWFETWERLGFSFSQDPVERQLEFLQFEYLRTAEDVSLCIKQIMELSVRGNPAAQRALGEFFRLTLPGAQT